MRQFEPGNSVGRWTGVRYGSRNGSTFDESAYERGAMSGDTLSVNRRRDARRVARRSPPSARSWDEAGLTLLGRTTSPSGGSSGAVVDTFVCAEMP
jgi:hypothetical protein